MGKKQGETFKHICSKLFMNYCSRSHESIKPSNNPQSKLGVYHSIFHSSIEIVNKHHSGSRPAGQPRFWFYQHTRIFKWLKLYTLSNWKELWYKAMCRELCWPPEKVPRQNLTWRYTLWCILPTRIVLSWELPTWILLSWCRDFKHMSNRLLLSP